MTQVLKANHIIGEIVLDEHGKVVDHPSRKSVPEVDASTWPSVLRAVKDPKFFPALREKNMARTKMQVRESVSSDILLMQAVSAIEEIDRGSNMLSRRIREWAGWWVPELDSSVSDHPVFARLIAENDRVELLRQAHSAPEDSMGAELSPIDVAALKGFASLVRQMGVSRGLLEAYVQEVMDGSCRNLAVVAGYMIGAKLLLHAGGLKRLSELPSSTIQLLGAEKALFRHLTTGAKPPKFGMIFNHPLVQSVPRKDQGRVARAVADKLSIAVKVDYFKGAFVGDKLKADLEKRFRR